MPAGRPRKFDYDDALDQAILIFWQKGYEGTSMPDLTAAMKMNRPSIYAAFGNKEALFCKALERYSEKTLSLVEQALNQPTLRDSIAAFLCGAVTHLSCAESPKGCLSVQGALACSEDAKIVQQYSIAKREKILGVLGARFARGIQDGELAKNTDTLGLARFYMTIVQGMSVQSSSGVDEKTLRGIADHALSLLP